jgi:hypothetical protein
MGPVPANRSKHVTQRVGSRVSLVVRATHFVIVPSMSEMTIWSVSSHKKMREVQVASPEYDDVTENCTVFGPGFKLSCSYGQQSDLRIDSPAGPKTIGGFWRSVLRRY